MKTRTEVRSKVPRKVNPQQVVYQLKNRVVVALNKVADRDTYKVGVQELEKTAECLSPDGIIPYLSCILDSDSEQKSAVRKECIRLMGVLARIHGDLIGPHLGKMVLSIVKRLKDQDSVVRDICVETMGVLASEFGNSQVGGDDGVFVLLVKPLFEVLGEQNKQIQSGAAMCLARVIDNMIDPPVSILQKMLARTMKLLKNPHFMAKPAILELNKSLIQAGGALSNSALLNAIRSIQDTLKDTDWTTRKSASLVLGEIGSSGGPFLAPFKDSCIQALESCRFDKVKPVRDTVTQALRQWRSIEGQDMPGYSDMVSSVKENSCVDDCSDLFNSSSSMWKDAGSRESKTNMVKKRAPFSTRIGSPSYADTGNKSNNSEWQIDVAVSKMHTSIQHLQNEDYESSSGRKTQDSMTMDDISMQDTGNEYDVTDEKQEYSSSSNHVSDNFTNKFMSAIHRQPYGNHLVKSIEGDQLFEGKLSAVKNQSYMPKNKDRTSLDSTITEAEECHPVRVSCLQPESEISSIRKHLLEIEKKQASLMDLLQGFTTTTMESLSAIQSKVSTLEHAVERISFDLAHGAKSTANIRFAAKSQTVASPAISTNSTPRPSIDMLDKRASTQTSRQIGILENKTAGRSKSNSINSNVDSQRRPLSLVNRDYIGKGFRESSRRDQQDINHRQSRNSESVFTTVTHANARENKRMDGKDVWKCVKDFLCEGDLESAYREALCSGNQSLLIELIDGTGPVLDNLSMRTISDLLTALASCFSDHKVFDSAIPWLQQIVDLSDVHGPNCIPIPLKVRREVLSAIQEALDIEVTHPAKRRLVAQLAMKLQQTWGKMSFNVS